MVRSSLVIEVGFVLAGAWGSERWGVWSKGISEPHLEVPYLGLPEGKGRTGILTAVASGG